MKCPKCGSEMVIRTAKRGWNQGSQFYGCSNYPRCKGIVNIDSGLSESVSGNEERKIDNIDNFARHFEIPVQLKAREKLMGYRTRFYDTMAIPYEILEKLNNELIKRKELFYFNKWRLDYPQKSDNGITEILKQVLLVAEKILYRGKITLISPWLEEEIRNYLNIKELKDEDFRSGLFVSFIKSFKESDIWFDGHGTEKDFYENIMFDILGENYKRYVMPQVYLSSLIDTLKTDDAIFNQRVDFLITLKDNKIVVELDQEDHDEHISRDEARDKLLTQSGYEVIRIKNYEIANKSGPNLELLINRLEVNKVEKLKSLGNEDKYVIFTKVSHQLQLTVLEAILAGFVDITRENVISIDNEALDLGTEELEFILEKTAADLFQLLDSIATLYKLDNYIKPFKFKLYDSDEGSIVITYNEGLITTIPKFIIQDITFGRSISYNSRSTGYTRIKNCESDLLEYFLNYIFRKEKFREGQYETIFRALKGEDTIVLLPTGSGKSIAFQLTAMLLPGVTIVIDPIISLIDDQVDNLERIGIDRAIGLTSQITDPNIRKKVIQLFGQGEYLFCYISPERFQTEEFRNSLCGLTSSIPIPLVAIDEAHCVSEWGHDFRTAYLNIGRTSRNYCSYQGIKPCILALTGTASSAVLKDVQRELQIQDFDAIITPKTFDRSELNYSVRSSSSSEKFDVLSGLLQRYIPDKFNSLSNNFYNPCNDNTNCGLIFCPHAGGKFGVMEIANSVNRKLGLTTSFYSGRDPSKGSNEMHWNNVKRDTAKKYKNNRFSLLVATKSFGMGIDKPNIRYTVHYGIPSSIESFYQEAGRAGRDRKRSECIILVSNDDKERTKKLLNIQTKPEEIAKIMSDEVSWNNADDITRAMYFHSNSFRGVSNELDEISHIINEIGDLSKRNQINIVVKDMNRNTVEKSVHRLLTLGVIEDYTINYSNNEFRLIISGIDKQGVIDNFAKYVAAYNRGRVVKEVSKVEKSLEKDFVDFIVDACKVLIEFIYDTVEKGRRRALSEMLALSEEGARTYDANQVVRERILKYLESSYSEEIEKILNSENIGFVELKELLEGYETETGEIVGGIRSPKDAAQVRGSVSRYLESTPDHPGLLLLRALSELYSNDYSYDIVSQNINAAIEFSFSRYNLQEDFVYKTIGWVTTKVYERSKEAYYDLINQLIEELDSIPFARKLLNAPHFEEDMIYEPATYLLGRISEKAVGMFAEE